MAISVSIELVGETSGDDGQKNSQQPHQVRKVEQENNAVRILVNVPQTMDGESANHTAALLLEALIDDDYRIERVKLSNLDFADSDGLIGLVGFLGMHAESIQHVSLKAIHPPKALEAFFARVFCASTALDTLNLSDNIIPPTLWKHWTAPDGSCRHRNLRQLILDYVHMQDEAIIEMAKHVHCAELEELYVVLTNEIGCRGGSIEAANAIVAKCSRNLSSLRWAAKDASTEVILPWEGLAEFANRNPKNNLLHLVYDGGTMTQNQWMCLEEAISKFDNLKTIKLRAIGLSDEHAKRLVTIFQQTKPPLEAIDWARNNLRSEAATAIASLGSCAPISKSLVLLGLERNRIEAGGARSILESFGRSGNNKIEIRLEGNPFHYGKVALNLACRKAQAEIARDTVQEENENLSQQNNSEQSKLHDQIARLEQEKAILLQALVIANVGSGNAGGPDEIINLFNRVAILEKEVLGIDFLAENQAKPMRFRRRASDASVASAPASSNSHGHKFSPPPQSPSISTTTTSSPGSPNSRPPVNFAPSPMRRSRQPGTSAPMMSPNNPSNSVISQRKLVVNELLTEQAPPAPSSSPRGVARATLRDMIQPSTEKNVLLRKSSSERWSETSTLSQKVKPPPQAPSSAYTAMTSSPNKKNHPSSPFSSVTRNKYTSPHVSSVSSTHSHGDTISLGSSSSTNRYQVS